MESGSTLEKIANEYNQKLPYRIVAALVDNVERELTYKITEPCNIEFLDLRDSVADRIYQRSLSFLYLKAVNDVLGNVETDIFNSINKGLYSEISHGEYIHNEQMEAIEQRMHYLVKKDLPIVRTTKSREYLLSELKEELSEEKLEILRNNPDVDYIVIYELDGYHNYFYGHMVPSTGYLDVFKLSRYKGGVLLRYPDQNNPHICAPYVDDNKIFHEFKRGWDIASSLDVSYVGDLNRELRSGNSAEIITIAERIHSARIKNIAQTILEQKKRIVLIAGPSSSGKTTFAHRLSAVLAEYTGVEPLYLGTDDYFIDRALVSKDEKGEYNFEDLEAVAVDDFNRDMNALLSSKGADLPTYDFIEGVRKHSGRQTVLADKQLVVIEGIHGLNANLSKSIPQEDKFKVYISPLSQLNIDDHNRIPTTDVRLLRRMLRDYRTRGKSVTETIRTWPKVRQGEVKNIFPYNHEADMVFNSALLYEVAVLRPLCEDLLKGVSREECEYAVANGLLKFLGFFSSLTETDPIPQSSIIREFIGGGILE
jgi:uridine kinase